MIDVSSPGAKTFVAPCVGGPLDGVSVRADYGDETLSIPKFEGRRVVGRYCYERVVRSDGTVACWYIQE
jgi:hypothetical protein